MTSLFISYSRKDIDFARQLTGAFKGRDLDFWIDWEGIPPTVDWWREIEKGIEEADTFLFLISPDSAKSKYCGKEIEYAVKNGKRLIPVVVHEIKADDAPVELRPLNWIFFREQDDFNLSFQKLITAIQTDYEWVQTHRQLQVKALEWERSNQENSFLLHGKELQEAEAKLAANASKEPHPTDLQREYILLSRQVTDKQRRIITGISIVGAIVMAVLAVYGFVQAGLAREQTNVALTRLLAAKSQTELLGTHDRRLSLLFAIEAVNAEKNVRDFHDTGPEQALRDAISQTGGDVLVSPDGKVLYTPSGFEMITVVKALSPAGDRLAIAFEEKSIHVWDLALANPDPVILESSDSGSLRQLLFSPTGRFLIAIGNTVEIWDMKNTSQISRILDVNPVDKGAGVFDTIVFSPDGQWLALLVSGTKSRYIEVLDLSDPDKEPMNISADSIVALSPQGRWLVTDDQSGATRLWNLQAHVITPTSLADNYTGFTGIFSPNGRWFSMNGIGYVNLWDMRTVDTPQFLPRQFLSHALGAFSLDETQLALISDQGAIRLANLQELGKGSIDLPGQGKKLRRLRISPDKHWIAAITEEGDILLWDLQSAAGGSSITLNPMGGYETPLEDLAFTPDSLHLISVSDDGVTRSWDLQNPYTEPVPIQVPGIYIDSFAFSSDGRWLAANGLYSGALLDLQNLRKGPISVPTSSGPLFFSPQGDQLISVGAEDNKIQRWKMSNVASGNPDPVSAGAPGAILSRVIDSRWLVTQLEDHSIQVRDVFEPNTAPKSLAPIPTPIDQSTSIATNGTLFSIVDQDGAVLIWDLKFPDKEPRYLPAISKFAGTLKLSPNGNWLVIADPQIAQLWDLGKSTQEPTLSMKTTGHETWSSSDAFIFSSDEKQLVLNKTTAIQILDLQNPAVAPITMQGLARAVIKIALSSDSHRLAVVSDSSNNTGEWEIRFWDLKDPTSNPIVLYERQGYVQALGFSLDGKWLVAAFEGGDYSTMIFWHMDIDEVSKLACEIVGSNLSPRQWAENFPPDHKYQKTCTQWPAGGDKAIVVPAG